MEFARATGCHCHDHVAGTPHRQCTACIQFYSTLHKRSEVRANEMKSKRARLDSDGDTSLRRCNEKVKQLTEELEHAHSSFRGSLDDATWEVIENLVHGLQKQDGTPAKFRSGIMWALIRNAAEILYSMFCCFCYSNVLMKNVF